MKTVLRPDDLRVRAGSAQLDDQVAALGLYAYECRTERGRSFSDGAGRRLGWVYLLPSAAENGIALEVAGLRLASGVADGPLEAVAPHPWRGHGRILSQNGQLVMEYESDQENKGIIRDTFLFAQLGLGDAIPGHFVHSRTQGGDVKGEVTLYPLNNPDAIRDRLHDLDPLVEQHLPESILTRAGNLLGEQVLADSQLAPDDEYLIVDIIFGDHVFTKESDVRKAIERLTEANPFGILFGRYTRRGPVRIR
jgi:hypothetical protein